MRDVRLIIGPPGSGKSTYAQATGLTHLEREQYATDQAFRAAAKRLAAAPDARLAVVRCCPTYSEQAEWEALLGSTQTVVLDVDPAECARRIHARQRPNWRGEVAAAKRWRTTRQAVGRPVPQREVERWPPWL